MKINPRSIQTFVLGEPCGPLARWLAGSQPDWLPASREYAIDVKRNQAVNRFLQECRPAGKEFLLLVNRDMVPLPGTEAILFEPGDLLYCGAIGQQACHGHYGDETFGVAFCRISAALLELIGQPAFVLPYNPERTKRQSCDCTVFQEKALQCGVTPRMTGAVGHLQEVVLIPDPGHPMGFRWAWPSHFDP